MSNSWVYYLAKGLEGLGLVVVLVGVLMSINLGLEEEGLESMKVEFYGLGAGGVLFVLGVMLERSVGSR